MATEHDWPICSVSWSSQGWTTWLQRQGVERPHAEAQSLGRQGEELAVVVGIALGVKGQQAPAGRCTVEPGGFGRCGDRQSRRFGPEAFENAQALGQRGDEIGRPVQHAHKIARLQNKYQDAHKSLWAQTRIPARVAPVLWRPLGQRQVRHGQDDRQPWRCRRRHPGRRGGDDRRFRRFGRPDRTDPRPDRPLPRDRRTEEPYRDQQQCRQWPHRHLPP